MRLILLAICYLVILLFGVRPAQAQAEPVTVETCRALVDQYGVPEQDPAITFQGGSQQAEHVALCQSLAVAARESGTELDQMFTGWADTNQDGTIDATESVAYFTAVRNGEAPPVTTPAAETSAPASAAPATATALPAAGGGASDPSPAWRSLAFPVVGAITIILVLVIIRIQHRDQRPR
jgi:hypothetical protein